MDAKYLGELYCQRLAKEFVQSVELATKVRPHRDTLPDDLVAALKKAAASWLRENVSFSWKTLNPSELLMEALYQVRWYQEG